MDITIEKVSSLKGSPEVASATAPLSALLENFTALSFARTTIAKEMSQFISPNPLSTRKLENLPYPQGRSKTKPAVFSILSKIFLRIFCSREWTSLWSNPRYRFLSYSATSSLLKGNLFSFVLSSWSTVWQSHSLIIIDIFWAAGNLNLITLNRNLLSVTANNSIDMPLKKFFQSQKLALV